MPSPFLTGVMTGFLERRTERMKEEDKASLEMGEQLKKLQLHAVTKQKEKYDKYNEHMESIRSAYNDEDYTSALLYAAEGGFTKATADQLKAKLGIDGEIDPSTLASLKDTIPELLQKWEEVEVPDVSAASTATLERRRQKINGVGDVVTKLFLGIGDEPDVYTPTPMKGLKEINRPYLSTRGVGFKAKEKEPEIFVNEETTEEGTFLIPYTKNKDGSLNILERQKISSRTNIKKSAKATEEEVKRAMYLSKDESKLATNVLHSRIESLPEGDLKTTMTKVFTVPDTKEEGFTESSAKLVFNRLYKGYKEQTKGMGIHDEDLMNKAFSTLRWLIKNGALEQDLEESRTVGQSIAGWFQSEPAPIFKESIDYTDPKSGRTVKVKIKEAYKYKPIRR